MNRRRIALAIVTADVFETGKAGRAAIRAFVENRMSRAAFNEAVNLGLKLRAMKKEKEAPE